MLEALRRFWGNDSRIEDVNADTQIVTDLGIYGDDFSEFYEILSETYGTDFLVPAECVPSEFGWMRTLKGWLPFVETKKAIPVASLSVAELDAIMCGRESHANK
ncbi:hypothetical protein [Litoreibacter roseus]|nr:hypothetical protein [Litoreibacter roseus]